MDTPRGRTPLAALDANAAVTTTPPPPPLAAGSKRCAGDAGPAAKRACPSPALSPDGSSVFDASWATAATAATVPDEQPGPWAPTPARRLTREQAREVRFSALPFPSFSSPPPPLPQGASRLTRPEQKVDLLRLRLGLASYKLRPGQTAVPLADLQPRPLPPRATGRERSAAVPSRRVARSSTSSSPPPRQHRLPSPPGAASGLLSLAGGHAPG